MLISSSKHRASNIVTTNKRGQEPHEPVKKPNFCLEYQNGMKGIDLQDHVIAFFSNFMRKTVKGYRTIFLYLLDICIFNAFVVHSQMTKSKRKPYTDFHRAVAKQILECVKLPEYSSRGRPSSDDTPLRLQ